MRALWRRFLACSRLSLTAVCEESAKGERDYHDFPDGEFEEPWHFVHMRCMRCGKEFTI